MTRMTLKTNMTKMTKWSTKLLNSKQRTVKNSRNNRQFDTPLHLYKKVLRSIKERNN